MRRRTFITGLAGATVASPLTAVAQQSKRLPVVGFVLSTTPLAEMIGSDPVEPTVRAFVHGLRDFGWIDGRTVAIERRSAEGDPQRAPAIFAELLARGIDVMMLGAARWHQDAALQATRTIPIVSIFDDDPVAAGLVMSLARPGGNLTGVTYTTGPQLYGKRLQLLAELAPVLPARRSWHHVGCWSSFVASRVLPASPSFPSRSMSAGSSQRPSPQSCVSDQTR